VFLHVLSENEILITLMQP